MLDLNLLNRSKDRTIKNVGPGIGRLSVQLRMTDPSVAIDSSLCGKEEYILFCTFVALKIHESSPILSRRFR